MNKATDIMIVDDTPRARQALAAFLSLKVGIQNIAQASNGMEAIKSIKSHLPKIILMDVQMPIMDGLEATRIIKKCWPTIKIVILTMYPYYRPDASAAGADAFLVKDCSGNELVSTILGLINADEVAASHP
jgi:DNA-binding NarL/FixJ family response regulator